MPETLASPADRADEQTSVRWKDLAVEGAVAFGASGAFLASCLLIRVYPLDRVGQVSGLASLAFRFALIGIPLVIALVLAARLRGGRHLELTGRLVCAAIAGIATAMVAGGILIALRGTPWGLNGRGGDAGALATWATGLQHGEPIPPTYPPLSLHVLAHYSDLVGLAPEFAIKHLQIIGTAMVGPVAYLSWRPLLRSPWALAIGVIAALPLIEPYKPFPNLVLIVFVPASILFLLAIRASHLRTGAKLARGGVVFGALFGLMALMYSGWFQWAAPGLLVAMLVVFPWRTAPRKAVLLLAVTGAVFLLFTGQYLAGLLFDPAGAIADKYIYFDVHTEPMYIAMWRNDTPGIVGVWPPHGELGGVGLFTLALAIGFGLAVALGRSTTLVIGLSSMIAGAWVFRFFFARAMSETKLVQLYPRTTPLILYCMLILTGFAIYWLVQRLPERNPLRRSTGLIGATVALLLVFASSGSATADRFMPVNSSPPGAGWLAYMAHKTKWAVQPRNMKARPVPWVRRPIDPAER